MSVKIPSIDEQHKEMMEMINLLHDSIAKGNSKTVLVEIFEGLAQYTKHHFTYEEKLFKQYGYDGQVKHIKEHQKLINKVNDLKQKMENEEGFMLGMEVMDFLNQWLTGHIQGSDKNYTAFLRSNGVK